MYKVFSFLFIIISFAEAQNLLTKIKLDNNDVLELYFKKSINKKDIAIKINQEKKIFDFKGVKIGDNIGSIDAMHTVSIAPNGKSNDARVLIDYGIANDGKLSNFGDVYRIKLTLNRNKSLKNKSDEENTTTQNNNTNACKSSDVIVIDAGHGGKDPGAISDGVKEKDIVLNVAKKLSKKLSNNGYKVYLTRSDDRFITLEERTRIADRKDAKIFVSLHCNAAPNSQQASLHGIETFFLQKTRDSRSQSVAARENASVLQGADRKSKSVILDSVLSGPKIILSNKLAIDIHKNILSKNNARNGGVKSAPFWVLVGASRPSVLVELGYITNSEERANLLDSDYQDSLAEGIANGIMRYQKNRQSEIDN